VRGTTELPPVAEDPQKGWGYRWRDEPEVLEAINRYLEERGGE
jgi:hypothetical protein